jgi:hypothetical protein
MKVYKFCFNDYMSYCGGCILVAANSIEEAKILADEERMHLDDGYLLENITWDGNTTVILNEMYAE